MQAARLLSATSVSAFRELAEKLEESGGGGHGEQKNVSSFGPPEATRRESCASRSPASAVAKPARVLKPARAALGAC